MAIAHLSTARPDVMVFGCTSAGRARGNAYEAELITRIADETGAADVQRGRVGARGSSARPGGTGWA